MTQVTNAAIIREMDAQELQEHAQHLYDKKNWNGISHEEYRELELCKIQFKQITGREITLEYYCPA